MKFQSSRRIVGFTAAMGLVVGLLSACMSLDYVLNVNADSTMSGTLKVAIAKQAASVFGLTSADDLLNEADSGDATSGMGLDVTKDCASSEDETNFILTCTFVNAKASDIDDGWSMTTEGDTASLHVVSNIDQAAAETDPAAFEMPDMNMGSYNFTINFPGKITKVTGTGAKQTSDTTVVAKGGLNDTIDFTVTGSTSSGSGLPWWSYLVIGLIAGAVVVAIIGLVRRGKKDETTSEAAPEPTTEATPEATTSTEIAEPPAT
ncbi:MAG: hypothetical protein F2763_05390 [Actinobacteria bacterium]|uniref:Unannotated protein n=1 Tax=freshwater metagenome TaxID=449393 RepID=A0A6J7AHT7_9ZZZZ|nr:hypothetical protein [Actinomycetota bacterium]